jgi:hypothetical protein
MRGKKKDTQFITQFITQCVSQGYSQQEEMLTIAKHKIEEIDSIIKEAEIKKIERSKLLDVIESLMSEQVKCEDDQILPLYNIQYPEISRQVCHLIKTKPISISDIQNVSKENMLFCLKQLVENKVIYKSGNFLLRGDNFDKYLTRVLKE